MTQEHAKWQLDGAMVADAMQRLPEEWTLRIDLMSDNARPYLLLLDEYGDAIDDGPEPQSETVAQSVARLVEVATQEAARRSGP